MSFHAEQRSIALGALFLSLGLAINVYAGTEVSKANEHIQEITQVAPVPPFYEPAPSTESRELAIPELMPQNEEYQQPLISPQEVNDALSDMKNQEKELNRFVKPLEKQGAQGVPHLKTVNKLLGDIATYRTRVGTIGEDQRDAVQDWWNARFFEDVDKVRAYAEIPQQLSGITKDLNRLGVKITKDTFKTAASNLGIDLEKMTSQIVAKRKAISDISVSLASGDTETAQEGMNDAVYQAEWHPGELLGIMDMTTGIYQQTKNVKDGLLKKQLKEIIEPMIEAVNAGEYRDANQAFNEFSTVMHKYERYFRQPAKSKLRSKMLKAFDAFERAIKNKFNQEEEDDEGDLGGAGFLPSIETR